jgi:hypothetical protein
MSSFAEQKEMKSALKALKTDDDDCCVYVC